MALCMAFIIMWLAERGCIRSNVLPMSLKKTSVQRIIVKDNLLVLYEDWPS